MYFRNNMYAIPSYKANETLDNSKCSQKVEWLADENAAPEAVTLNGKYFKVEKNSGFYRITITLADSWGNAKDYIYEVPVGGVSEDAYREGTVVYLRTSSDSNRLRTDSITSAGNLSPWTKWTRR